MTRAAAVLSALLLSACSSKELRAWRGTTPLLDGAISPGEYDNATEISDCRDWTHTLT